MLTKYEFNIAQHYSAYRPSLHKLILGNALQARKFQRGLDVGCGTGQSAIALKQFCSEVIGIDPSEQMISKAIHTEGIKYESCDLFDLTEDQDHSPFDIITFAGSLFYTKSQELLDKLLRITTTNGMVVVYDFKINLEDICYRLFGKYSEKKSHYNHNTNFSDLDHKELSLLSSKNESLPFDIKSDELAHLILSSQKWYLAAQEKFKVDIPFSSLVSEIITLKMNSSFALTAETFCHIYQKGIDR